MPRTRDDRVHIRISPELKKEIQDYCRRRQTTLSDLVSRFFVRLLEKELEDNQVDAEQI